MKNRFTPVNNSFTIQNWGKGVYILCTCFPDDKTEIELSTIIFKLFGGTHGDVRHSILNRHFDILQFA